MDAKTALAAAAALDDIASSNREPTGKTIDAGAHGNPPGGNLQRVSNARAARRFRDRLMTKMDSCESLWTSRRSHQPSGVDLTFAIQLAASPRSECQIQNSTSTLYLLVVL